MKFSDIVTYAKYKWYESKHDVWSDQKRLIENPAIIFDVGANTGNSTMKYRRLYKKPTIYAFEPDSRSLSALAAKSLNERNIRLEQCVVGWKHDIMMPFNVNNDGATNSVLENDNASAVWSDSSTAIKKREQKMLRSVTVDGFCEERGIKHIDILKSDVQGYDLHVLLGACKMMSAGSVSAILVECLFVPLYKEQAEFNDISKLLKSYNLDIFGMYDPAYAQNGRMKWCDVLFVHRRIL